MSNEKHQFEKMFIILYYRVKSLFVGGGGGGGGWKFFQKIFNESKIVIFKNA